jgi:hypothetical protein
MSKQYAERDIESLDEVGGFYSRHVSAMTGEGLHTKSSIAAELGHRDMVISELLEALQVMIELHYNGDNGRDVVEIVETAQLAVEKALGETK